MHCYSQTGCSNPIHSEYNIGIYIGSDLVHQQLIYNMLVDTLTPYSYSEFYVFIMVESVQI